MNTLHFIDACTQQIQQQIICNRYNIEHVQGYHNYTRQPFKHPYTALTNTQSFNHPVQELLASPCTPYFCFSFSCPDSIVLPAFAQRARSV